MRIYSKGSVQKDRGEWKAVVSYQDGGVQRRLTKRTGVRCFPKAGDARGKQGAERILRQWRDELVAKEARAQDAIASTAPLYEFCSRYAESKKHVVKDSTYLGYVTELNRLAGTRLASTPLADVTPEMISLHESQLVSAGLSGTSLKHHHAFLAAVFRAAVANGKIPFSPFATLRSPKARHRAINSLTAEERAHVLELILPRIPDEFATAVSIALMTGMRRGEICALRWIDVDLDVRTIKVNGSFSKSLAGGYTLTSPKDPGGSDSRRTVPIGAKLAGILRERQRAMAETRGLLALPWKPDLFVAGNPLTGKPYSPDLISRDWRSFCRANAIFGSQATYPVFHDLRHTFATLAIKDKAIDVKALAEVLGHKDAALTLNFYADALEEAKRAGMDRLDEFL